MWQLEIYPSLMEGAYIEHYKRSGTLAQWLKEADIEWENLEHQPIIVTVNGDPYPPTKWKKRIKSGSVVKIRVIPFGFIGKLIGKILNFIMKIFGGKPKTQTRVDTPQSKSLESVEATGNTPKLGEVVPEILGTFRKYPDYLVQPHRYYLESDPRIQMLEFHACVGPGEYTILSDDVKLGNTALKDLGDSRAEYTIYTPNADLEGVSTNTNWYNSREVGATSSGSTGIDLNSEVLDFNNVQPPTYAFSAGNTITRSSGTWPNGWEVGTIVRITKNSQYTIQHRVVSSGGYVDNYTDVTGDFKHLKELGFLLNNKGQPENLRLSWTAAHFRLYTTGSNRSGVQPLDGPFQVVWADPSLGLATVTFRGLFGQHNTTIPIDFFDQWVGFKITSKTPTEIVVERYLAASPDVSTYSNFTRDTSFLGFTPTASVGGAVTFLTTSAFGAKSATFAATPSGEVTDELELDFFFPSGLSWINDSGAVLTAGVAVQVVVIDFQTGESREIVYSFSSATVDQIGYTKTIRLGPTSDGSDLGLFGRAIQPMVSVRRITAASTSTSVNDKVTWQGLKSLLPNVNRYPNWTTIGVVIQGGGKVSSTSENQINVIAQRKMEPLGGGIKQVSSRIEDYVQYIATTAGYTADSLHTEELARLGAVWAARGDTINHIFDETTVEQALSTTLAVGFADLTVENGKLKPVRDEARTVFEQAYSAQNMLQGGLERQFKAPRPDDIDGVEVDYMDTNTWTRKTVVCTLPNSLRIRLKKVKIDGVTDRTRAWRHGMRQLLISKYRTWSYSFSTELDAMCSNYLSYVPIFDEIPSYSQTALVTDVQATPVVWALQVTLTEDVKWEDYNANVVIIAFRDTTGICSDFFYCIKTNIPNIVEVQAMTSPLPAFLTNPRRINQGEPIHAFIGVTNKICLPSLITEIAPNGYNQVNVKAVNYDARVYENDDKEPPLGA